MPEHTLDASVPPQARGLIARHPHVWLGLMLLALHAGVAFDLGGIWTPAFLLTHFGLFLLWQPLWQGDGTLKPSHAALVILNGVLLAAAGSGWLLALWITALIALIGGSVPGISAQRERVASLLAALYLLALLLMWVVPRLAGALPPGTLLPQLVRYGLPLIALAILFIPPAASHTGKALAVDLFYSVMLFLLMAALVLGSLVIANSNQGQYLLALAQTLVVIALALVGLSWLMSPTAGFAGFDQVLSRYLLSVGLPFEQWVQRLAELAQRESEPRLFMEAAAAHIQALPWVTGVHWETREASGQSGRQHTHFADFHFDDLTLRIHTRWTLSPAMLLHVRLLAQMVGHFYAAKQREQLQRRNAYTQAIHETGSRLTHDVKNMLQSLQALCAAAQDPAPDQADALVALMQRQLPQITQRLNTTLDKLRAPTVNETQCIAASAWWPALQQRHAHRNVQLSLDGTLGDQTVPGEMLDCVVDNLIENALRKSAAARVNFDPSALRVSVSDNGEPVPKHIAAQLFSAPVPSRAGLGVGLYHAARFAAQQGYALTLAHNEAGEVCFAIQLEKNTIKSNT